MTNNLFPYPGNKARHAEWIIQHIPEHTCYVEPFGGAAGVLFNKPKSKVEVYNDLDGDIVHFFEVLRDRGDELQEWLGCVPFSRQLHEEWTTAFYDGERPDDDIERAGRFFYLRYSQFGGKYYGTSGFCTRPQRNGAHHLRDATDRLDDFAERLRGVVVELLDWTTVIERYDKPGTLFYCDPPYPDDNREGYYGCDGFDHKGLHDTLAEIKGDAIVSYDRLLPFYGDGWQIQTRRSTFNLNSKDGNNECDEYLIMNFDAGGKQLMSDVGQQGLEAFTDGGNPRS